MAICDRLRGSYGYYSRQMSAPPSEKRRNVLQLALTDGCSYNRCTFCSLYKAKETPQFGSGSFGIKTFEEFVFHAKRVLNYLEKHEPDTLSALERIFIGGGNALTVDTKTLQRSSQFARKAFYDATGNFPRRISIYGNTNDILMHGRDGLPALLQGGINLVFWGLESGNKEVLKIAGKGYDDIKAEDTAVLLNKMRLNGLESSLMVIPGLGGERYYDKHILDTVRILRIARPRWITFIGLHIIKGSPYERWIIKEERENRNRRLTPREIAEQTAEMIEKIDFKTTVGVHGEDVHGDLSNPVPIGSYFLGHRTTTNERLSFLLRREASARPLPQAFEHLEPNFNDTSTPAIKPPDDSVFLTDLGIYSLTHIHDYRINNNTRRQLNKDLFLLSLLDTELFEILIRENSYISEKPYLSNFLLS